MPPAALIETERVRRAYTGGSTSVLYTPGLKWYYMSQQQDDEVVLFKNFDSENALARCECGIKVQRLAGLTSG